MTDAPTVALVQEPASPTVLAVAARLRQLRTAQTPHVTQDQLAEKTGLSISYISMLERGERSPTLDTLATLATALGVSLGDLFDTNPAHVEPQFRPLIEACRQLSLSKADLARLASIARSIAS